MTIAAIQRSLKIPTFPKIDTGANYFTTFLANHNVSGFWCQPIATSVFILVLEKEVM